MITLYYIYFFVTFNFPNLSWNISVVDSVLCTISQWAVILKLIKCIYTVKIQCILEYGNF